MPHRQSSVRLAIACAGNKSDGATGDQFPNENNATPPAVGSMTTNVKAQINFLKVAVKWEAPTKHSGTEKTESDDTDKSVSLIRIQFCAEWHEGIQHRTVDRVVEYREMPPLTGQKSTSL